MAKHYIPKIDLSCAYLKFWGTRGSCPVSGSEYVRHGGNTPCLEVCDGENFIIIDAGSGIRALGEKLLDEKIKKIHIFIGHTHWDHVMGMPFFAPLYKKGYEIHIWSPASAEKSTKTLFSELLGHSYFPVSLEETCAKLIFKELRPGEKVKVGKIEVETALAFHPGATACFKVKAGGKTFGYATDNEMLMGYLGNPATLKKTSPLFRAHARLIRFFKGCDLLIHEAQYTPLEYKVKIGWGHSSISNAAFLVKHAGIREWIVTHHDPRHTDEDLQFKAQLHHEIMEDLDINCHIHMAYDGQVWFL